MMVVAVVVMLMVATLQPKMFYALARQNVIKNSKWNNNARGKCNAKNYGNKIFEESSKTLLHYFAQQM